MALISLAQIASSPANFALLQVNIWNMVERTPLAGLVVLGLLVLASFVSWAIIFSKWSAFGKARNADTRFLRAFRKASGLESVMVASEQFRPSPLVSVFDFGYEEVARQVKAKGGITNRVSIERTLQLGASEALAKLERNMNWLATAASVSPFVGLLGTVVGIIRAFEGLGAAGSSSLRAVAPGIADALIATAAGLFAAIPASIFYNYFGSIVRETGTRMDDFSLEFMNMAERSFGE